MRLFAAKRSFADLRFVALAMVPVLALVVPSGVASASVPVPLPSGGGPLGLPGSALTSSVGDLTADDMAFLAANGIDAAGLAGAGAVATDVTLPVVGGFLVGYAIGTAGVRAYQWAFGSSHTVDGDESGGSWSLYWQPTGSLTTHNNGAGGGISGGASVYFSTPTFTPGTADPGYYGKLQVGFTITNPNSNTGVVVSEGVKCYRTSAPSTVEEGNDQGYTTLTASQVRSMSVKAECPGNGFTDWAVGEVDYYDVLANSSVGTVHIYAVPGYVPGSPSRTLDVSLTCHPASGSDVVVTATSAAFHETDATLPEIPAVSCPDGYLSTAYEVDEVATGLPTHTLVSWTAPSAYTDLPTTYPDCASTKCLLDLQKMDAASSTWVDCFSQVGLCDRWLDDPTLTDDYQCVYGSYVVDLSECDVYAPTFDVAVTTDGTTLDPNPKSYAPPGTTSDPNPAPTNAPTPSSDCPPPLHWGLSLVTPWWYFHVGQCVFEWAFVPTPGYLTAKTDALTSAWDGSLPGSAVAAVGNVGHAFVDDPGGSSADCAGPGVDVGAGLGQTSGLSVFRPLYACDGIFAAVHGFLAPWLLVALWTAAGWTSWRYVARAFGMAGDG